MGLTFCSQFNKVIPFIYDINGLYLYMYTKQCDTVYIEWAIYFLIGIVFLNASIVNINYSTNLQVLLLPCIHKIVTSSTPVAVLLVKGYIYIQ